ncbi:protein LONGIFOLIA 1 [Impatiens glandulifera]|uniref:protein LONGIFOLIA 1 n=1 Tax=Impatiens glandulifera TaxID=253017 RepID=UPI001FB0D7A4|nr:protein LONGIFOLIA 1 [Impatiens glandulifera]
MASKLLHSLTDNENTDLQRQIGCMTGIFQIFDRHHVLTGGRHINPKKLQQTTSHFNTHDPIESHKGKKIFNNNAANEKQRIISMESSQTSFSSSSRSSSFSSIDCSRTTTTAQPETGFSFERVIFPDTPSRIAPINQSNASPQFSSHQSIDLRDVVKDSMLYREVELTDWSLNQSGDVHRKSCNSTSTTNIFAFPKDCPRFSYDLGENFKSTAPRLSLDSSSKESKPRLLRNSKSQREGSNCLNDLDSSLQQTSTIHKRLPSVVAKLMGLEALPANETQTMPSMKTSVVIEEPKSSKQGSSRKEPTSPRRRNNDFVVMKPITTSRFPIEPAPWKQIDGGKRSQSQRSKTTVRATDTFPSVYGEIEKRMKDIEFTQAGKDLRALKQILDAMQTKGLLETEIEDDRKPVMKSRQIVNSESPIVIMKPAKLVEKSSIPTSSVIQIDRTTKDQIKKSSKTNVRTPKPPQSSSRRSSSNNQLPPKDEEKSLNSAKTSSISPRLHQKKLELQKKSRPPTPPSDSNKSRRQSNSIQPSPSIESNSSPGGKRRAKPLAKLKKEEKSNHSSDGYIVSDSATEIEVTSSFRPAEKLDFEELVPITAEQQQQPSPVSVLDNSIYSDNEDDSTNGNYVRNRKKLENVELLVEKLKKLNSGHNESQTDYIASLCEDTNPDHRYISEILLASGLILRDLNNSTSEEAFRFHPSGYPINPELYLVLEQTKASKYKEEKGNEKVHRKLVFDLVNEILSVKLLLSSSVRPYSETRLRPAKSCLNGQKLLKELCCEIDKQHKQIEEEDDSLKSIVWEDVLDGKGTWMDFSSEISDAVLDVERMLFKDLVDEIVRGEEAVVAGRFRRQIFLH